MTASTPITSEEFLTLARECQHKASWQVSEHNADRLFNMADMFRGLAARQERSLRITLFTSPPENPWD